MAARENESNTIVGFASWRLVQHGQLSELLAVFRVPTKPVETFAAGGGEEPRGRSFRYPVMRPVFQRLNQSLGHEVLSQVEVIEETDQRGCEPARLLSKDTL